MSRDSVKILGLTVWPFGTLVASSVVLSALHALIQHRWSAIRYKSFGPRPADAQAFIACELLLVMVILTVGMTHIANEESNGPVARYYLGIAAAVGTWAVVSFLI